MTVSLTPSTTATTSYLSSEKPEVFYSYAHEDESLRDELEKHLTILQRQGVIKTWHDRKISAGTDWAGQISQHLESATIILLLISPDFLASDYCYNTELKRAMERHRAGEAWVIPIILRDCDWKGGDFAELQALPKDAKPVVRWRFRDAAFADVAVNLRKVAQELVARTKNTSPTELAPHKSPGEFVRSKPPARGRLVVTLDAPSSLPREMLADIVELLRGYSGEAMLSLQGVEAGSLRLLLNGVEDAFERLQYLVRAQVLTKVLDFPLQNIEWLAIPDKHSTNEALETALQEHAQWLKTNGKQGKLLDLSGVDLQGSDLQGSNLRGARLSRANLKGTNLEGTNLRDADLQHTDLVQAKGLFGYQLGGANLRGAMLPAHIAKFDGLSLVTELSKNAGKLLILLLLVCVYTQFVIVQTEDAQLFTGSGTIKLPTLGSEISTIRFYLIMPFILLGMYAYFHLYLQRLWETLARLPAIFPDGESLDQKTYPWPLNDLVRDCFPLLRVVRPPLSMVRKWISTFIAWWLVPLSLFQFWARYLVRRDPFVTTMHVVLIGLSVWVALRLYHLAKATLHANERELSLWGNWRRSTRSYIHLGMAISVGICFFVVSQAAFRSSPGNWISYTLRYIGYTTTARLYGARLAGRNLFAAKLPNANLVGAQLKGTDLRTANLRLSNLNVADLTRADLRRADLTKTDLREARLMGANLTRAILHQADASDADLTGCKLIEADFSEANLTRANFSRANLAGADFSGADLTDIKLSGAVYNERTKWPSNFRIESFPELRRQTAR